MILILVYSTIRKARILPAESASVALPHKKCSADFLSKSLIALIATVDSAQVGLVRRQPPHCLKAPLSHICCGAGPRASGTGVNAVPLQSNTKASRFRATTLLFVVTSVRTSGLNPTLSASKSLKLLIKLCRGQFARHSRQLAAPAP